MPQKLDMQTLLHFQEMGLNQKNARRLSATRRQLMLRMRNSEVPELQRVAKEYNVNVVMKIEVKKKAKKK